MFFKASRIPTVRVAVALMSVGIFVAGCGSSSSSVKTTGSASSPAGTVGGSGPGSTSGAGSIAAGSTSGKSVTLGFVALNNQPFSLQIAAGIKAAAAEYGASVKTASPSDQNASGGVANFQNLSTSGVQGIIVDGFPANQWKRPISIAVSQGIQVNSVDASSPGSGTSFHIGPPRQQMSAAVADELVKSIPGGKAAKGSIIAGVCVAGVPEFDALVNGLKTELNRIAPGITVTQAATGTSNSASFAAWQRIVPQNPDALAFVGLCDPDLPALVKLKQSNPTFKWLGAMTTGGENPVGWTAIPAGTLAVGMSQRGFVQGYVTAKLMLENIIHGKPEPKGWIDCGFDLMTKQTVADVTKALSSPEAARTYYAGLIQKLTNNPQTFPDQNAEQSIFNQPTPTHDGTGVK